MSPPCVRLLLAAWLLGAPVSSAFGQPLYGLPAAGVVRIEPLQGGKSSVHAVAVSDDNRFVAAVYGDYRLQVWERASGRPVASLHGWSAVAFAPGGKLLATGNALHEVPFWGLPNGEQRAPFSGHTGGV